METASEETVVAEATVEEAVVEETPAEAALDPALVAAGEAAFRQCKSCHQVGEGAVNRTGPQLNGVVGRTVGSVEGFRYSRVFEEALEAGDVWSEDHLAAYLTDPRGAMPGTKMAFRGVRSPEEITALTAYLKSFSSE